MNAETIERIRRFTQNRDWDQFHSPVNLAKFIVIEAAETEWRLHAGKRPDTDIL